ncbi:MAG: flavodoxin [Clostridia bacterium]|nr:flavodoxin [Clostridia bacterium]
MLTPGNTAKLAGWIQQRVGGDLFSIVVTEPYPSDYDACLDRAADEKADNARPALVNHVENINDYDVIFLGYPNWWYSVPMAIFSFIEEYDLSGKTIVPFCAHGTSGLAGSVQDIAAALPDSATVLEPVGVYRPDIDSAQPRINEWLDGLGFTEQAADTATDGEHQLTMTVAGQMFSVALYDTPAANALYDSTIHRVQSAHSRDRGGIRRSCIHQPSMSCVRS